VSAAVVERPTLVTVTVETRPEVVLTPNVVVRERPEVVLTPTVLVQARPEVVLTPEVVVKDRAESKNQMVEEIAEERRIDMMQERLLEIVEDRFTEGCGLRRRSAEEIRAELVESVGEERAREVNVKAGARGGLSTAVFTHPFMRLFLAEKVSQGAIFGYLGDGYRSISQDEEVEAGLRDAGLGDAEIAVFLTWKSSRHLAEDVSGMTGQFVRGGPLTMRSFVKTYVSRSGLVWEGEPEASIVEDLQLYVRDPLAAALVFLEREDRRSQRLEADEGHGRR